MRILISSIDNIVNAVPRTAAKLISSCGDGKGAEGLVVVPAAGLTYVTLCAAQGATVGYVISQSGGSTTQAIIGATAATVTPPIMWATKRIYDIFHRDRQ